MIYVPMGTRCSPGLVLWNMGLRKESLPFDWIEATIQTLIKFIRVPEQDVDGFVDGYFSEIDKNWHPDGTWLPHNEDPETFKRRMHRFREVLSSEEDKLFLTSVAHRRMGDSTDHSDLRELLRRISRGKLHYVSFNVTDSSGYYPDANWWDFRVPSPAEADTTWDSYEDRMQAKLKIVIDGLAGWQKAAD